MLAKRKTAIMKEMEADKANKERLKKMKVDRIAEKEKQLIIPTIMTTDYERQLRKLATRGGDSNLTVLLK